MEQKEPKISVVIPAYNAEEYIRQAIQSVIDQTLPELIEVIVVDDCSKDRTGDAVKELFCEIEKTGDVKANRVLRYFRNESNEGVAKTRNRGVQNAKGEYVAFLDGDDFWDPVKLEKQINLLSKDQKAAFCFTGRELIDQEGNSLNTIIPAPEIVTYKDMLRTNYVTCSSVLMQREVAAEHPMDHDEYCEDYICWMHILRDEEKALGVNEPLVKYRMVKGSKSNNKKKAASDHYHSLRILGYAPVSALIHMISYAYNGIKKYS